MKKSLRLIAILILIIILEISYLFLENIPVKPISQTKTVRSGSLKNSLEIRFWSERISKEGEKKAYQEFKKKVKDLGPGEQHSQSHIFGEALYRTKGINGVSICDNSFAFGCYHSFLGTAIYLEGVEVVPILNQKCIENLKDQSLGCQHGIGHGIMADSGYQYHNLTESLKVCDKLPVNDPIGGCIGGVFMEYNFQTLLAQDGRTRVLDHNSPLFPCQNLEDKFRTACYFWQSQWWGNVFSGTSLDKYQQIGKLCYGLVNPNQKQQCYIGSGNALGQFINWKADEAIKLCHEMPSQDGEIYCRAGAAGAFSAEPTAKDKTARLCQGFGSEIERNCIRLAKISIGSIQENQ